MLSDSDVLEEDDIFVQYGDNGELVFYCEEWVSMEEFLVDVEDIILEFDWFYYFFLQKLICLSLELIIE